MKFTPKFGFLRSHSGRRMKRSDFARKERKLSVDKKKNGQRDTTLTKILKNVDVTDDEKKNIAIAIDDRTITKDPLTIQRQDHQLFRQQILPAIRRQEHQRIRQPERQDTVQQLIQPTLQQVIQQPLIMWLSQLRHPATHPQVGRMDHILNKLNKLQHKWGIWVSAMESVALRPDLVAIVLRNRPDRSHLQPQRFR